MAAPLKGVIKCALGSKSLPSWLFNKWTKTFMTLVFLRGNLFDNVLNHAVVFWQPSSAPPYILWPGINEIFLSSIYLNPLKNLP